MLPYDEHCTWSMASSLMQKSRCPWPTYPHLGCLTLQTPLTVTSCLFSFSGLNGNIFRSLGNGYLIFSFYPVRMHELVEVSMHLCMLTNHTYSHVLTHTYTYSHTFMLPDTISHTPLNTTQRQVSVPTDEQTRITTCHVWPSPAAPGS